MATLSFWPDPRVKIVAKFLEHVDYTGLDLWGQLDTLSTHTSIESAEVPTEGVVVGPDDQFSAAVNLYLSLQYGNDDNEGFSTADSFLARIKGHFEGDRPVIDSSGVDTSSFYA